MFLKKLVVLISVVGLIIISCSDSTSPDVELNQPTEFIINQQNLTQFQLNWQDNSKHEEGYKIEREFDEDGNWEIIAELDENENEYLDDIGLSREVWLKVKYRVYSYDGDDTSDFAEVESLINFAVPSQLTASYTNSVLLEWVDNSEGEEGFKIERKTGSEEFEVLISVGDNDTLYNDLTIEEDETYYYRVIAFNGILDSAPSNIVEVTTTSNSLTANFSATPLSGNTPLVVSFTDLSTGEPISWRWDFGNGETANESDPIVTFSEVGLYTIALTVSSGAESSTETKTDYIAVEIPGLTANFSANLLSGIAPLNVSFTDLSTGNPTSWEWDFENDGTIDSYDQNPTFTYITPDVYTISLKVSDGVNQEIETKTDYLEVLDNSSLTLFENFEGTFPPAGWLKLSPDGGSGWDSLETGTTPLPGWTGGEASACPGGGLFQAFATWTTGGPASNDQWIISPQITIQDGDVLDFWMAYYFDSYTDHLDILISTTVQDDVNAFDVVVDEIEIPVGSPTDWTQYMYNLVDFVSAGTQVYIAFREVVADNFNDGSAIGIDNIQVGSNVVRNLPVHIPKSGSATKIINNN